MGGEGEKVDWRSIWTGASTAVSIGCADEEGMGSAVVDAELAGQL